MKSCHCFVTIFSFLLLGHVTAEHFTSTEEYRLVLKAQKHIAQELKNYISAEQERLETTKWDADLYESEEEVRLEKLIALQKVKRLADEYERDSLQNEDEVVKFISNPVNAYLVAKRFRDENFDYHGLVASDTEHGKHTLERIEPYIKMLPSQEDFEGTIMALLRLQDTFALPAADFAKGIVPDAANTTRLSADDCFEIGRHAYTVKDYYHTILWMQEAYNRLNRADDPDVDKQVQALDYLSFAVFMQGNLKQALKLTKKILKIKPGYERAVRNKASYKYYLKIRDLAWPVPPDEDCEDDDTFRNERIFTDEFRKSEEFRNYEALCRGEDIIPVKDAHKLYCDYATNNDPRLLIAPLKREVAHLDPWIMVYYDVISDAEIKYIKEISLPLLNRATILNPASGKKEPVTYRISKTAWLGNDTDKKIIPRLLNRVTEMTQLTLENCEEFQTSNYGIGGQFEPHYDFATRDDEKINAFPAHQGNRIATVLFYLTDIPAGGSTVFTTLGVKVKAVKGAAAVWYNLYKNGDGDFTLRHAACPVLVGNKWVLNKWYHIRGNEFWHPCGKNENDRFTPYDIEKAEPTYHRAHGRFQFWYPKTK